MHKYFSPITLQIQQHSYYDINLERVTLVLQMVFIEEMFLGNLSFEMDLVKNT